jgi:hypothetical protein
MVILGFLCVSVIIWKNYIPQSAELISILAGDTRMPSYQIQVLPGGTEIEFRGGLRVGSAKELERILAAVPQAKVLHIESPGGRIGEAKQMMQLVRQRNLTTYTSEYCLSAATLVLIAGNERVIAADAKVGFHAGTFPGATAEQQGEMDNLVRSTMQSAGVSEQFISRVLATPPEQMWYPSFEEMLRNGVVTSRSDGERFASNIERNKRFGNVLQGFADEVEKSMKNGTLPKFNPPGDKTLAVESRILTEIIACPMSVIGRMNEELDSVSEKPVFDPSVLSSKTNLKEEIQKRIKSYHIVQKWQPELPRLVFDAMKKKVDSYNHADKEEIIRGIEQAMTNQRPMFEQMCNLLEKKETAEQAFLSFMASRDYQIKDGQMIFRSRTATQSEQYNALGQRVEDSYKEKEAFRKQRLDDMKKSAEKFNQLRPSRQSGDANLPAKSTEGEDWPSEATLYTLSELRVASLNTISRHR